MSDWETLRQHVLQRLREWVNRLPPEERDMPFMVLDGQMLTPRDMLYHVEAGDRLGWKIVEMEARRIRQLSMMSMDEIRELIRQRYLRKRGVTYMTLAGLPPLTPQQIAEMIARGDPRAQTFVESELQWLKYLESLM